MDVSQIIDTISERVNRTATVKTVYGEPVIAEGKTIIPVAKVRYGFGGGGGWGNESPSEDGEAAKGAGGGGGGGIEIRPVGMIEITTGETRYVSFEDKSRMLKIAALGMVLCFLLMRRRLKMKERALRA
jgi:uncharacterized spore protein YtfJ